MNCHAFEVEQLVRCAVWFLNLIIPIRRIDFLHFLNNNEWLDACASRFPRGILLARRILLAQVEHLNCCHLRQLQFELLLNLILDFLFLLRRIIHILFENVMHCLDVHVRHHF